jgi:hypothetical protein
LTSDVVSGYVCWHVGSSSGLIQHVYQIFYHSAISDLKWLEKTP